MGFINFILNLAALLIWLKWRTADLITPVTRPDRSLLSTLKRAEAPRQPRWLPPAMLAVLLGLRSVFYWNIGSAVNWVPSLHLMVIAPSFRSDWLGRMVLFSLSSFGLTLVIYYICLLLLSVVNRGLPENDPLQKLTRYQLGFVDRWPLTLKLALPFISGTLLWAAFTTPFSRLGIIPAPDSTFHLWEQALVIGLHGYLPWKLLVIGLLLFHVVNSYVFLGNLAFWQYVNDTSQNLLTPLRNLPLRLGRLDFAPLLGVGLVLLLSELAQRGLAKLYPLLPY